ncbi:hypothetical protein C8Q78DRAFT_1078029 [Trametes maxima]|nr:hypothetical protein C8Q78DRAFT_1078029 [Trametes maxima]
MPMLCYANAMSFDPLLYLGVSGSKRIFGEVKIGVSGVRAARLAVKASSFGANLIYRLANAVICEGTVGMQNKKPFPQAFGSSTRYLSNDDVTRREDLTIRGEQGIKVRLRGIRKVIPRTVNPAVNEVDAADGFIDDYFPSWVCCARAYLGEELNPTAAAQRPTEKVPREGYTLGHLITNLMYKQFGR